MANNRISIKVKMLRADRAWSQAHLAEITSLNIRTIQRLESLGKGSQETLLALAAAFDIDVSELTSLIEYSSDCKELKKRYSVNIVPQKLVIAGLILMFPGAYFFIASVFNYYLGVPFFYSLIRPLMDTPGLKEIFDSLSVFVFLGGLSAAAGLNFISMISINKYIDSSKSRFELAIKPHAGNIAVVGSALFVLTMMIAYAFVENFGLR